MNNGMGSHQSMYTLCVASVCIDRTIHAIELTHDSGDKYKKRILSDDNVQV